MFRKFLPTIMPLALVISLPLATEALAKSSSQLLSKQSRYSQVTPDMSKEQIKALCAEILAHQNDSPVAMTDAASVYLHGMIMGVTCAKTDYYKAYQLDHDAKDAFAAKATLTFIVERANAGNAKAIRALEKLIKDYDLPLIKVDDPE